MSPKRQRRGPKAEPQILDFAARVPLPRIPPKCRLPKSALEKGAIALNSWVRVDRPLANGGSEVRTQVPMFILNLPDLSYLGSVISGNRLAWRY